MGFLTHSPANAPTEPAPLELPALAPSEFHAIRYSIARHVRGLEPSMASAIAELETSEWLGAGA